jgi:hypothetical protein
LPLAQIQAVPSTPDEIEAWSFVHAANHLDILRRIFETKGQNLTSYFLDNFDPAALDRTNWLYLHGIMHQQMDSVLGIQPYNLIGSLDWQDPDSVAVWFNAHSAEHVQASTLLGIG